MRASTRMMIVATFVFGSPLGSTLVSAQTSQAWQMPPESERCPSKWGTGDERGAGNWMKPATVLRAARLIRTGEVFELGQVLSPDPKETYFNTGRSFNTYTKPSLPQPNTRNSNEELVVTELGQIGTQFDGFAHQMYDGKFYNCFEFKDLYTRNGFQQLGVENVGTLMTRGVMIDVAALKGVETLPESYAITPEDLQQALARQNLKIEPGDAVIVHTGWGKYIGKDNARYGRNWPGLSPAAGVWIAQQDPMLVGADNCCIQFQSPVPADNALHGMMLIQHGIHLLESLKLEELAAARAYEFALILQPLKIKGGTGSTVAPVAIR